MSLHRLEPKQHEKLLVLASLFTTFAGAFLLVVTVNF